MPESKFKRRQMIVDKGVQMRFMRFVTFAAVGLAFVTSATVFYTTFAILGQKLADVYPQGRLIEIFRSTYIAFALILAIFVPLVVVASMRFSHRIFGPLPKVYQILRQVGSGDFSQKLILRKGDQLVDLAVVINEMIDKLKEKEKLREPHV